MAEKNNLIAVMDSGVGGISVLRHLVRLMPNEQYLYYGDSANAPYGTRPTEEVCALTFAVVRKIMAENPIKALVVACNTATAAAIEALREAYPELIIVGIEPALKLAADHYPGGHIGVLATQVTLREAKFAALLQRYEARCRVEKIPAPGLVELVEAGKGDSPEMDAFLEPILRPYAGKLDALVLGCTHYPFAAKSMARILGEGTALLDGGEGTARETMRRLTEAGLCSDGPGGVTMVNSAGDEALLALSYQLLEEE